MRAALLPTASATALIALAALLAGCGHRADTASYFPLEDGARWDYRVTTDIDGGTQEDTQTIRVLGNRTLDGDPIVVRRSELGANVGVEYLLRATPHAIERVAQRTDLQDVAIRDDKPRTVLPLPLKVGATWMTPTVPYVILRRRESPRELKYSKQMPMQYTVETLDDKVSVPAGNFEHCARVRGVADVTLYTDGVSGFRKVPLVTTEWYCRGVGLVKLERVEKLDTLYFSGGRVVMALADYELP